MNNAEKFKQIFGLYATELWSMPEGDFLAWLNRDVETTQTDHIAESSKKVEQTAEIAQNVQNEDLILRKAAIESIRECAEVAHDNREWGMEQGYLNAIECVEEEPPAQPEIIRCKDCKHWRFDHTCREHSLVSPMMANEFCSRAERREG